MKLLTPGAALLWTVLIPGSAHLRLGYPLRGALAFVTAIGLCLGGYAIVGDRIWYFTLFEPFALIAPVLAWIPIQLLPEAANLGGTIVLGVLRDAGSGPEHHHWLRAIRLPVPGEHLGLTMTGFSGLVAALWAADAHALARGLEGGRLSPGAAAASSWLFPGLAHVLLRQRSKGLLIGAAVVFTFALGLLLSAGHAVDRPLRSAWWIPQSLFGGGTLFATFVTAPWPEMHPTDWIDFGIALCAVAGLMNLIVMIDAYTLAERDAGRETAA